MRFETLATAYREFGKFGKGNSCVLVFGTLRRKRPASGVGGVIEEIWWGGKLGREQVVGMIIGYLKTFHVP